VSVPISLTVNGKAIPASKIELLVKQEVAQGKQPDSPQLRDAVKRNLVVREVLIQEADKQGFGTRPEVKAALENAIWDLEAQRDGISLSKLIGGVQESIACGVSLGIQPSIAELLNVIDRELAAGYQRIKLKVKPGWDLEVLKRVRERWYAAGRILDGTQGGRLVGACRDQGGARQ